MVARIYQLGPLRRRAWVPKFSASISLHLDRGCRRLRAEFTVIRVLHGNVEAYEVSSSLSVKILSIKLEEGIGKVIVPDKIGGEGAQQQPCLGILFMHMVMTH
jgi:hypothetical protein